MTSVESASKSMSSESPLPLGPGRPHTATIFYIPLLYPSQMRLHGAYGRLTAPPMRLSAHLGLQPQDRPKPPGPWRPKGAFKHACTVPVWPLLRPIHNLCRAKLAVSYHTWVYTRVLFRTPPCHDTFAWLVKPARRPEAVCCTTLPSSPSSLCTPLRRLE